ncbi:hypothetical protein B0H11DRAFT_2335046 [Mycena galericulata]|nr:hypothetical protein B0H11DRAFT_2335046 [Mycena galericulata]
MCPRRWPRIWPYNLLLSRAINSQVALCPPLLISGPTASTCFNSSQDIQALKFASTAQVLNLSFLNLSPLQAATQACILLSSNNCPQTFVLKFATRYENYNVYAAYHVYLPPLYLIMKKAVCYGRFQVFVGLYWPGMWIQQEGDALVISDPRSGPRKKIASKKDEYWKGEEGKGETHREKCRSLVDSTRSIKTKITKDRYPSKMPLRLCHRLQTWQLRILLGICTKTYQACSMPDFRSTEAKNGLTAGSQKACCVKLDREASAGHVGLGDIADKWVNDADGISRIIRE